MIFLLLLLLFFVESCALPKDNGTCEAQLARWHYSESDKKCMPFYFTGCGGNKNSFISREDCEKECPLQISKYNIILGILVSH